MTPMADKTLRKAKSPEAADYRAAWRACRKLVPGEESDLDTIAVMASFSTCCWTNTKRQNSYLNQSKYCCAPYLVPLSGQPVRSKGSRRKLVR